MQYIYRIPFWLAVFVKSQATSEALNRLKNSSIMANRTVYLNLFTLLITFISFRMKTHHQSLYYLYLIHYSALYFDTKDTSICCLTLRNIIRTLRTFPSSDSSENNIDKIPETEVSIQYRSYSNQPAELQL